MDENDFMPPAIPDRPDDRVPGLDFKPERINSIQDVVDCLSYAQSRMWNDSMEMSSAEARFWNNYYNWSKNAIAAMKERDAHSPEVAAKEMAEQLRIVTGAKKLDPARMLEILTSRNFAFSLEQYMVDVEVVEDKKDDGNDRAKEALDKLQKRGLPEQVSEYFDAEVDEDAGGAGRPQRDIDELSF